MPEDKSHINPAERRKSKRKRMIRQQRSQENHNLKRLNRERRLH